MANCYDISSYLRMIHHGYSPISYKFLIERRST